MSRYFWTNGNPLTVQFYDTHPSWQKSWNIFLRNINFHYQNSSFSGPEHELYLQQLNITHEKSHVQSITVYFGSMYVMVIGTVLEDMMNMDVH